MPKYFCTDCQHEWNTDDAECPKCGSEDTDVHPRANKTCSHCGRIWNSDDAECPECMSEDWDIQEVIK